MKFFPIADVDQKKMLQNSHVIAIDIGFASVRRTCGLSTHPKPVVFTNAVKAVADFLESNSRNQEVVLIVEAPLSAAFNKKGPCPRGRFETHHTDESRDDRAWYYGAGSATYAAALHFFRQLATAGKGINRRLHIIEGFVSRYGDRGLSHTQVAAKLVSAWNDDSVEIITVKDDSISTIHLIDPNASSKPPIVLRPPDAPKTAPKTTRKAVSRT